MATKFKGYLNNLVGDADFGKIQTQIDVDQFVVGDQVRVKLVDPTGVVVRDYPVSPDYTVVAVGGFVDVVAIAMPETSGDFVRGTYTIFAQVISAGPTTTVYESTFLYDPSNNPAGATGRDADGNLWAQLTPTVDCSNANIKFTDTTDESGWTVDDEEITVQPPLIPGVTPPSPVTGVDEVSLTFEYTQVTYTGALVIERHKDMTGQDDWLFIQQEIIYGSATQFVDCGRGICDLLPCLNSMFTAAYNSQCTLGGWAKVPAAQMANLNAASILANMYYLASECGDLNAAEGYRTKFTAMFGEHCDCGCAENNLTTTNPIPYP